MIIFLSGLSAINQSLFEASKIDGANAIDTFRFITVPLLSPTIFFVVVITCISSFQVFDLIFMMTQGGRLDCTNVLVYAVYKNAFEYFKIGNDVDYNHNLTILVNNVIVDRKSIDRIRNRNEMKIDIPLWNIEYKYNPEFWKTYNIFLDKPLDTTVRKDLELEIPLENQFIDGGLKNSKK